MEQILIVGGGFRGIVASYFLTRAGCKVTLVESAPFLGGVMHSSEWNGFHLDKGCHLFSNDDSEITETLLDIMGGAVVPVSFKYASAIDGKLSDGFAIPDLTAFGPEVCARILYETIEAASRPYQEARSLEEALRARFGQTAADHLGRAAAKMLRARPDELDAAVLWTANFGRIRAVPEEATRLLKVHPVLDERLAGSSQADPFRYAQDARGAYPFRNFYPAERGMRGFCDAAERHLAGAGVELCLGTRLDELSADAQGVGCLFSDGQERRFDRAFWTADLGILSNLLFGKDPLTPLVHKVPMVLYYYVVDEEAIGPHTYIHDFTAEDAVFRVSAAGRYGQQITDDGRTYVCCEATTEIGSPLWENPEGHAEKIWRETAALGMVNGPMPDSRHVLKTPVSYRVGRPGHQDAARDLRDRIVRTMPQIALDSEGAFYRNDILKSLRELVAA